MCWIYTGHLQTVGQISVGWLHPYLLLGCTVSFKVRVESDPQTTSVAVQCTDNAKGVDAQRERMVVAQCCRYKQSIQLMEYLQEFTLSFTSMQKNYYV